ncbi:Clcn7, partial [Symbiodinium sp. CCMP2456]
DLHAQLDSPDAVGDRRGVNLQDRLGYPILRFDNESEEVIWMQRRGKPSATPDEPMETRRRRTEAWRAEVAARWHELRGASERARAYRRLFACIVQDHGPSALLFAEQLMNPVWEMQFPSLWLLRQPRPSSVEAEPGQVDPHPAAGVGDIAPPAHWHFVLPLDFSVDPGAASSAAGPSALPEGEDSMLLRSDVETGEDGVVPAVVPSADVVAGPGDVGSLMDVAIGVANPSGFRMDEEGDECTLMDRGRRERQAGGASREAGRDSRRPARSVWDPADPSNSSLLRTEAPVNVDFTVFPRAPRTTDQGLEVWRHLLGIASFGNPSSPPVARGGPFIPDDRAEYMHEVLGGFNTQEQAFMTLALITAIRALLTELGQILHAASMVDVLVEDHGHDEDEDSTLMLQIWSEVAEEGQLIGDDSSFVQKEVIPASGIVQRLQRALEECQPGVARLRAASLRVRVGEGRGAMCGDLGQELLNHVDALCVATSSSVGNEIAEGFAAKPEEVEEWTWHWWQALLRVGGPRASAGMASSSSVPPLTLMSTPTQGDEVDSAEVNEMAEDERVARGQREEEEEHVNRFLREEAEYMEGVTALLEPVEHDTAKARRCQAWDDWAMFNAMNAPPVVPRKRKYVEMSSVAEAGSGGAAASSSTVRLWVPSHGDLHLVLRTGMETDVVDVDSEADTVKVQQPEEGRRDDECPGPLVFAEQPVGEGVPMEFEDFQRLFDQWKQGVISNMQVQQQFGAHTLDLLQTQMAVLNHDGDTCPWEGPAPLTTTTETILDALVNSGSGRAGAGCGQELQLAADSSGREGREGDVPGGALDDKSAARSGETDEEEEEWRQLCMAGGSGMGARDDTEDEDEDDGFDMEEDQGESQGGNRRWHRARSNRDRSD